MKQEELQKKLDELKLSGFIPDENFLMVDRYANELIKGLNDVFGYNDGEPLEEDGIKFVLEVIKYKWWLTNAVCE